MNINLDCIYCTIKKADSIFSEYAKNGENKLDFMRKVFGMAADIQEGDTAPFLSSKIMKLLNEKLEIGDMYCETKSQYNQYLLSMEEDILKHIYSSEDKLYSALQYAMIGNFIDFGAMDNVDIDKLKQLIENAADEEVDLKTYEKFVQELKNTKKIVYIVDNAGELVFDKIFIEILQELYPKINISVIVRGEPIYNDATIVDAKEIGLTNMVEVIENGTNIPGTQLNKINDKAKEAIDNADLIISKGQGNFESLHECGKNIYYIFLCKCNLFIKRFNIEKFKGVFAKEEDVKELLSAK